MTQWDLARLTSSDFEQVCRDLMSRVLGCPLEIFAGGPDGGIDLRFASPDDTADLIVQCKHYVRSGKAKMMQVLRDEEKPKVDLLRPSRYIVCTSVELTPHNKQTILDDMAPWIKSTTDIYGADDIDGLLRDHEDIVRAHPRLWFSGAVVLQAIVNNHIHQRSQALMKDTDAALLHFVVHEGYHQARLILHDKHVCLLSGMPGIGKTTLAQVLSAEYAELGYEVVDVGSEIDEGNQMWLSEKAQLFYFDDFLGQTALDDLNLGRNEDRRIVEFMRRVANSENKRLILTTRTYILQHARQRYEQLATTDFEPFSCVIELEQYTKLIRARILYNHIYFSALDEATRRAMSDPAFYSPIANHPNFTPRLLALSISRVERSGETAAAACTLLRDILTDPGLVWDFVIDRHLAWSEQRVLDVLASGPAFWNVRSLRAAWDSVASLVGHQTTRLEFSDALAALDGSLIRSIPRGSELLFQLINPSLRDHLISRLGNDRDLAITLARSAIYLEQYNTLSQLACLSAPQDRPIRESMLQNVALAPPLHDHLTHLSARLSTLIDLAEDGSSVAASAVSEISSRIVESRIVNDWSRAYALLSASTLQFTDKDRIVQRLAELLWQVGVELNSLSDVYAASDIIRSLGDYAPPGLKDEHEREARRVLEAEIEELSALDDGDDIDSDVFDLVDFVQEYFPDLSSDYDDTFSWLQDRREHEPDDDDLRDAWRESEGDPGISEDDVIHSMFDTLREG